MDEVTQNADRTKQEGSLTPWEAEMLGINVPAGCGSADDSVHSEGNPVCAAHETGTDDQLDAPARSYAGEAVGLGIDIVEIARMERILEQSPSFAERVFTQDERDYCNAKANPATHFAMRFAAREAVVKALGTGFAEGVGVRDVEVVRAKNGKPLAKLTGGALARASQMGVRELSLSLSYTHTEAVACAMAVTESAMRATEKRKDPMEELARQFKETRSILDEL